MADGMRERLGDGDIEIVLETGPLLPVRLKDAVGLTELFGEEDRLIEDDCETEVVIKPLPEILVLVDRLGVGDTLIVIDIEGLPEVEADRVDVVLKVDDAELDLLREKDIV